MPTAFTFDVAALIQGSFFFLLFIFALYGVFLAYHWYAFGTSKHTSTVALAVYLSGGAVLFLTLAGAMQLIS